MSLRTQAEAHVARLEDAGVLGALDRVAVAVVLWLAEALDHTTRGYAVAHISRVFRTARALLPALVDEGDPVQAYLDDVVDRTLRAPAARRVPEPRYHTAATPGAQHETRLVRFFGLLLGIDLMAWQERAARVITEIHPSGTGWRWTLVVITVPRQCGKTLLIMLIILTRIVTRAKHLARYTAQTGKDAVTRWLEFVDFFRAEHYPAPARRILVALLRGKRLDKGINRGAGNPHVALRNGSVFSPFTPGPAGLDGGQTDTLVIDEAFSQDDESGEAMEASANPTSITRPWRQRIILSTRGPATSTWFNRKLAQGVAALDDPTSRIAIIDYSVPDGFDIYAESTLQRFHPAYGVTITLDALAEEMGGPRTVWERSYCNRQISISGEGLVDGDLWAALVTDSRVPATFHGIGISVARDRSAATIAGAWRKGREVHAAIIATGPGTSWLGDTLPKVKGRTVWAVPEGPTVTALDALPLGQRNRIARLGGREHAAASQAWLDHTWSKLALHLPAPGLDGQLAAAVGTVRAGCVTLNPDKSAGPVDQIEALMLATAGAIKPTTGIQVY